MRFGMVQAQEKKKKPEDKQGNSFMSPSFTFVDNEKETEQQKYFGQQELFMKLQGFRPINSCTKENDAD